MTCATKFEYAKVIADRALEISIGKPPLVKVADHVGPIDVAKMEWDARVIPIVVRRVMPDGSVIEIKASEMWFSD